MNKIKMIWNRLITVEFASSKKDAFLAGFVAALLLIVLPIVFEVIHPDQPPHRHDGVCRGWANDVEKECGDHPAAAPATTTKMIVEVK